MRLLSIGLLATGYWLLVRGEPNPNRFVYWPVASDQQPVAFA